jgi:hypothetical protein
VVGFASTRRQPFNRSNVHGAERFEFVVGYRFLRVHPPSGEMRILVDTHQQGVRAGIRVHEIRLSAIPVLRDEKRQQKHW